MLKSPEEVVVELAVKAAVLVELDKAAAEVVQPARMIWVVVGDRAKIEAGIKELGLGELRIANPE